MSTHITMNEQQTEAITSLLEYIQNPDPDSWFFVLRGFAGTGKTFCMQKVVQVAAGSQPEAGATGAATPLVSPNGRPRSDRAVRSSCDPFETSS